MINVSLALIITLSDLSSFMHVTCTLSLLLSISCTFTFTGFNSQRLGTAVPQAGMCRFPHSSWCVATISLKHIIIIHLYLSATVTYYNYLLPPTENEAETYECDESKIIFVYYCKLVSYR